VGFGDMVVGKQVGRMVGALGGRLGAYRAPDGSDELRAALVRNLWRGKAPADAALDHVANEVAAPRAALAALPVEALIAAASLPGARACHRPNSPMSCPSPPPRRAGGLRSKRTPRRARVLRRGWASSSLIASR